MPSSAHPAPREPAGPPGDVIPFSRSTRRSGRRPPQPLHAEPTPEQRLAETIEALFLRAGHTLSDDTTASIYRCSLDALQLMLDASRAREKVGEDEHRFLTGMVDGMRAAPGEL